MSQYLLFSDFERMVLDIENHPHPAFTADILNSWYKQHKENYGAFLFHLLAAIDIKDSKEVTQDESEELASFNFESFDSFSDSKNSRIRFAKAFIENMILEFEDTREAKGSYSFVAKRTRRGPKKLPLSFGLKGQDVEMCRSFLIHLTNDGVVSFLKDDQDIEKMISLLSAVDLYELDDVSLRIQFDCSTQAAAYAFSKVIDLFSLNLTASHFDETHLFYSKHGNAIKSNNYYSAISKINNKDSDTNSEGIVAKTRTEMIFEDFRKRLQQRVS